MEYVGQLGPGELSLGGMLVHVFIVSHLVALYILTLIAGWD